MSYQYGPELVMVYAFTTGNVIVNQNNSSYGELLAFNLADWEDW